MPRFRSRTNVEPSPLGDPRPLLDDVFRPCQFYIAPALPVTWQHGLEEAIPWETYQGRLLDPAQTRQRRTFLAWNLVEQTATGLAQQPLIAIKWDRERGEVHVIRGLECHVWEACDVGGNVIDSRETIKWVPELVGTLALADFTDADELRDELICRLWQAVVGTSRLPLTSLEAPLPGFALGQLAYVHRSAAAGAEPMRSWRELLQLGLTPELAKREQSKLLETVLRAATPEEIPAAAALFIERWRHLAGSRDLPKLLRAVFNDVSLSPYTRFVDNALAWLHALVQQHIISGADEVDFLSWLLRQLGRHLTAYDLITFHHRGANYPDALLLDAAFKRLLHWADHEPALFTGDDEARQLRRRALRHGALLRRAYEGHAVPDAPTSPGENSRVLPAPFLRVPDEQLASPQRRERKLFAGDPLERLWTSTTIDIFRRCLHDLIRPTEMKELGMAIFVDRPLGFGKEPLEPDQTPLLAQEAYSRTIVCNRLGALVKLAREINVTIPGDCSAWTGELLGSVDQDGGLDGHLPLACCGSLGRPVAALADALRVGEDFGIVRTLPSSWCGLREWWFDWHSFAGRFRLQTFWRCDCVKCMRLALGSQGSVMALLDDQPRSRVLFESDPSRGYRSRGGIELPVAGLRIWKVLDDDGIEHDLRGEEVRVLPCW